jgi:hypothetical protein
MSRLTAAAGPVSQLATRLATGVRGLDLDLPKLGKVHMQLLGHVDVQMVESEVFKAMGARGMELTALNAQSYEAERAVRTLAIATRTVEDRSKHFGSLEDWLQIDSDLLVACWHAYGDVREQLDPIPAEFNEEMAAKIAGAVSKKNGPLLRMFGVVMLSAYLLTMADPPAIVPTAK